MRRRLVLFLLFGGLVLILVACTLPGASSPTPFVFPTPNLTLTAVFAPTATDIAAPPTEVIISTSTETPASEAETALPSDTPTSASLGGDTRPNGSPVVAKYLETGPIIDGDLSEWEGTTYSSQQIVFGASNWTGTSDASAQYSAAWDDTNLYIGVIITDDAHVQVSRGRFMYKGDEIEIQLDTDLAGDFTSSVLSADDYQIGLSPGNFSNLGKEAYRWFPRSVEGYLTSPAFSAKKTSTGYNLEARIPWVIFGITPADDARFGFALSISDNDLAGSSVQQSMVSSVSTRKLTDPTTWGTLVLER
jgi:hypothetical protein